MVGNVRGHVAPQRQPLFLGAKRHRLHAAFELLAQLEVHRFEGHASGLDLRDVEDVVDHPEQRLGRRPDQVQRLALFGGQVGVEQQARSRR